jgi:hypothetical protein
MCALELIPALASCGIRLRAGVHIGECERGGDEWSGLAVHTGARIGAMAAAGEVLTNRTVRDLSAGSGLDFQRLGAHKLKGLPEEIELFGSPGPVRHAGPKSPRSTLTRTTRSDLVLFSIDNHVALITVNDPDRRTAVTAETSVLLRTAVEKAEADPDVQAVVITGAGKAFCAGTEHAGSRGQRSKRSARSGRCIHTVIPRRIRPPAAASFPRA